MKCVMCCKEFESKRSDAKCCSSTCRSKYSRATDKSDSGENSTKTIEVMKNVEVKDGMLVKKTECPFPTCHEPGTIEDYVKDAVWDGNKEGYCAKHYIRYTDSKAKGCAAKGCNLDQGPGHDGLCIYHWREKEHLPRLEKKEYLELNKAAG